MNRSLRYAVCERRDPMDEGIFLRGLADAGCTEEEIRRCPGGRKEREHFLRRRREKALDELHAAERRIDCLDWLLCELSRTEAERKESQ